MLLVTDSEHLTGAVALFEHGPAGAGGSDMELPMKRLFRAVGSTWR